MSKKLSQLFKGDRKYFTIVFFILILILITGIITPVIIKNKESNWKEELSEKITYIENSVKSDFISKEDHLLKLKEQIKNRLYKTLSSQNTSFRSLVELVNKERYDQYSIEVLAPNGKLISWNDKIAIPQEEIFPLSYPIGQVYFYNSNLYTYLTITDTIHVENDIFYLLVSLPVQYHFAFQNSYFERISYTKMLSDKYSTQFQIDYNSYTEKTKDGRKYSFEILNNKNNKIALVTINKPSLTTSVNNIYETTKEIQSLLILAALIFLSIGLRKDFLRIKSRLLRLLAIIIYCTAFRIILFYTGFTSFFFKGSLIDPSYFSSTFAFGFVKSPAEFFITNIFLLIIAVQSFRYLREYFKSKLGSDFKWYNIILLIPVAFLFLVIIRGLSASLRSVIFDSTLRYFKEPDLIPSILSVFMNLNIFMLGFTIILVLTALLFFTSALLPNKNARVQKRLYWIAFLFFQIFGIIYIQIQNQPLINILLSIIFVAIVFSIGFLILFYTDKTFYSYVYLAIAASIITVTLLNYFNLELERESLKTTALEINRPNDNLLRFLINETLRKSSENRKVIDDFLKENTNYDAVAFVIWSRSALQKESLNSSISLYDKNKSLVGRFSVGIDSSLDKITDFNQYSDSLAGVNEIDQPNSDFDKFILGVKPVKNMGITIGYISASLGFDIQNLGTENIPDFLESNKNLVNSVIDINQLKIFEFTNSKIAQVYGDIYPSRDQIKPILNANFSQFNEAWLNLTFNGENYLTYVLKTQNNGQTQITAVSVMKKHFTWNLFNFFKIFIIQSLFIIILFIFFFIINIRQFKYSFRTQLLIAFLIISIVPLVILAVYNHQVVDERTQSAIFNELDESTSHIEQHIRIQLEKNENQDILTAFKNAGRELGISFTVFESSDLVYSTQNEYYFSGLFPRKLNTEAYYQLYYLSYREFLAHENFGNYKYDAFYKKVSFDGKNFVIEVNDAFNNVKLNFSTLDVDVFLFGIYSFAVILIIILSTILANRISSPIRRLTKATDSVAHGDLNVEIDSNEKGELKDLIEGFNSMTSELQKNQNELAELERENAWKEMAKQVAHEIKNPLTPMKLAVQQLIIAYKDKNKNFDSIFEKVSGTILNQIESLSSIASEFSRFAKMPSLKLEVLEMVSAVKDSINLFVDEKIKIELNTFINEAYIEADKSQLRRLVINLIRNSIQADSTQIEIYISEIFENYQIDFKDNGKGIPENYKEKIFESNFTTKEKGMGIGLKLAKRFLEGINGNIQLIESNENGTLFRILIPKYNNNDEIKNIS